MNGTDKKIILKSCAIACVISVMISGLIYNIALILANQCTEQNMQKAFAILTAYVATATDSEYAEIAQEIRHDLIFHTNAKQLVQYIPNTATDCPTCQNEYEYPIYFLANNTGELYYLDTERQLTGEQLSLSAGYDEISQTSLSILYDHSCIARIKQKQDTVSVHRMKTIFCDDCINKILAAIDGQSITAFVIFMPQEQAFYPICENTELQISNGTLAVTFNKQNREMCVEYSK